MSAEPDSGVGVESVAESVPPSKQQMPSPTEAATAKTPGVGHPIYLLTPVSDNEEGTVRETLDNLVGRGWYVFGDRTPGRKALAPGDRICFYATTQGVVAEAEVATAPERGTVEGVRYPDRFPWRFKVRNARFFYEKPVIIDAELRRQLEAFKAKDPAGPWAWFVQGTKYVTAHDFAILTGWSKT